MGEYVDKWKATGPGLLKLRGYDDDEGLSKGSCKLGPL